MIIKILVGAVAASLLVFSAGVSANEVVSTVGKAKGGQMALDFMNSGGVTALEFEVVVPKGVKVDTSKCVSELPSSHVGACRFNEKNGRVVVMVYSNDTALLPEGMVSIGRLQGGGIGNASVRNLLISNVKGESVASTSKSQAQSPEQALDSAK